MTNYRWVPEDQYKKALFHIRSQIAESLGTIFSMYGQQLEVQIATAIMVDLAEQFAMVIRGKNIPIIARPR